MNKEITKKYKLKNGIKITFTGTSLEILDFEEWLALNKLLANKLTLCPTNK